MTVGAIVWTSIMTAVILAVGISIIYALVTREERDTFNPVTRKWEKKPLEKSAILGIVATILICAILIAAEWGGHIWYYQKTAKGQRAVKTQQSNFSNGIEREVKVYDVNGKLVAYYDGKFDITYDDDRILFDDEKGKRHIVYYPTGTVVVDEK